MTRTFECSVDVFRGDIDRGFAGLAGESRRIAWDIETSGLDWSADLIGTCQVATNERVAIVLLDQGARPRLLADLLQRRDVQKIFHHAPFDLRFMMHRWGVRPANVACTKVASKLLEPLLENSEHSLMPVLRRQLGVSISKDQQVSNWLAEDLSSDQLAYAAGDVRYLVDLYEVLSSKLEAAGLSDDQAAANDYLPARVRTELRGLTDVFAY